MLSPDDVVCQSAMQGSAIYGQVANLGGGRAQALLMQAHLDTH
jgi:hypothetical protein